MISFICAIIKKKPHGKRDQISGYQRQGVRAGGIGVAGQRVTTSSYKMNKYEGCNVQDD